MSASMTQMAKCDVETWTESGVVARDTADPQYVMQVFGPLLAELARLAGIALHDPETGPGRPEVQVGLRPFRRITTKIVLRGGRERGIAEWFRTSASQARGIKATIQHISERNIAYAEFQMTRVMLGV